MYSLVAQRTKKMTTINVNVSPDDIESAIVQAVMDSALGVTVAEIVQKEIEGLANKWQDTPLRRAIKQEVQRVVVSVVSEEYSERIKQAVRDELTDETLKTIVSKAVLALYE